MGMGNKVALPHAHFVPDLYLNSSAMGIGAGNPTIQRHFSPLLFKMRFETNFLILKTTIWLLGCKLTETQQSTPFWNTSKEIFNISGPK
jgi:hypothetical protein